MKKPNHFLLASILFAFCSLASAQTQDRVTLYIGDWEPYTSKSDVDMQLTETIVREAFATQDVEAEIVYVSWNRAYKKVQDGAYFGSFPWSRTVSREGEVAFSEQPIIETSTYFFHLKESEFNWQESDDLRSFKIGATLSYSHIERLRNIGINPAVVDREKINFKKLLGKRIDAYPAEREVGFYQIKKLFTPAEAARFTYHKKPFYERYMYYIYPRNNAEAAAKAALFDKGILTLKANGRYNEIIENFMKN